MSGGNASSRWTGRVGHHREEMRRRTGDGVRESRVPGGERFGHGLPRFVQPHQVVIHLFQQTLARGAD